MYIISELEERNKTNIAIIPEYDRPLIISTLYTHVLGKDGVGEDTVQFSFIYKERHLVHVEYLDNKSRDKGWKKSIFQIEEFIGVYNIKGRLRT